MSKLKVTLTDGSVVMIEGRRFSHYVAKIRFWFFLHKSGNESGFPITHIASVKRICTVPYAMITGSHADAKVAAIASIDFIVAKIGEQRARSILMSY